MHDNLPEAAWLSVDFQAPAPDAAAALLAAGEGEAGMRRTLAGRIGALAALLHDAGSLDLVLRCASCGEGMEAAVPLAAIAEMAAAAEAAPVLAFDLPGHGTIRLRRPTGADQRAWRGAHHADADAAARAICAALLLDAAMPDAGGLAALGEAMAEADPLPAFRLAATCPACGSAQDAAVDLEAVILARLAGRQRALLDAVHHLAGQYGWTEAEILALPPHRRRAYLDRIAGGAA